MKILWDFLPIALFFLIYRWQGIYAATIAAAVAALLLVLYSLLRYRRAEPMQWVSLAVILILGGLTILLRDRFFIMLKPTVLNLFFAVALMAFSWVTKASLVERLLAAKIFLPPRVWRRLDYSWVVFFLFGALLNLAVVGYYMQAERELRSVHPEVSQTVVENWSCEQLQRDAYSWCREAQSREGLWVNFKLFGLLGLSLLFVLGQSFYMGRFLRPQP